MRESHERRVFAALLSLLYYIVSFNLIPVQEMSTDTLSTAFRPSHRWSSSQGTGSVRAESGHEAAEEHHH